MRFGRNKERCWWRQQQRGAFSRGRPCVFLSSTYWCAISWEWSNEIPSFPISAAQEEGKEGESWGSLQAYSSGTWRHRAHSPLDSSQPPAQRPVSIPWLLLVRSCKSASLALQTSQVATQVTQFKATLYPPLPHPQSASWMSSGKMFWRSVVLAEYLSAFVPSGYSHNPAPDSVLWEKLKVRDALIFPASPWA